MKSPNRRIRIHFESHHWGPVHFPWWTAEKKHLAFAGRDVFRVAGRFLMNGDIVRFFDFAELITDFLGADELVVLESDQSLDLGK